MQNKFLHCVLASLVGLVTTRVAAPEYFTAFGVNPHFVEALRTQWQLAQPSVNYPPSVQWIDNPWYNAVYDMAFYGMGIGAFLLCTSAWIWGWSVPRLRGLCLLSGVFIAVAWSCPSHFMRYALPAYPILFALSSRVRYSFLTAPVIFFAAMWATTFTGIYRHDHTRVQAAKWVAEYLLPGRIAYEGPWEDRLPIQTENEVEFNLFSGKYPDYFGADYIFITSRRVLGSAGRVFPETRRYYEQLFSGILPYRLVKTFSAGLNDESADESFQVYDHPDVFLFARSFRKPPNGAAE